MVVALYIFYGGNYYGYETHKKELNQVKQKAYDAIEKCLYELEDYSCAIVGIILQNVCMSMKDISKLMENSITLTFTIRQIHNYRVVIVEYGDMTDEIKEVLTHTYNLNFGLDTKEDKSFERKVKKYITNFLFDKEKIFSVIPEVKYKVFDEFEQYTDKMYEYNEGDYYYKYLNEWNQSTRKIRLDPSNLKRIGECIFFLLKNGKSDLSKVNLNFNTPLAEADHYHTTNYIIERCSFAECDNYVIKISQKSMDGFKNPAPYDVFFDDSDMEYVTDFVNTLQRGIDSVVNVHRKISSKEIELELVYNKREISNKDLLNILHAFNIKTNQEV